MTEDGAPAYVAITVIWLVIFGGLLAFAQPAPVWYVAVNVLAALLAAVAILGFSVRMPTPGSPNAAEADRAGRVGEFTPCLS